MDLSETFPNLLNNCTVGCILSVEAELGGAQVRMRVHECKELGCQRACMHTQQIKAHEKTISARLQDIVQLMCNTINLNMMSCTAV